MVVHKNDTLVANEHDSYTACLPRRMEWNTETFMEQVI